MTDQSQPAPVENTPSEENAWTAQRAVYLVSGIVIGVIMLIFVVGLLLALIGDVETTAWRIQIIRDIFLIILALQGILIIVALAVLIMQVARLVNLLQNEVMPILENTQETIDTAKGTVEFVGESVTGPIIRFGAFWAGLRVLLREWFGIRRALRREVENEPATPDESTE